nr:MAG TPA: hypothetical protein [Caudoviricetes sp.]
MEKTKSIAEDISIIMSIERTEEYFKNIENNDWFICGMLLDRCKELVKKSGLESYKKIILNIKIESVQLKYNEYLVKNNDKINNEFEKVIKEIAGCDIDA